MGAYLRGYHNAEVPRATAPEAPHDVWLRCIVRFNDEPIRSDDGCRDETVAREPVSTTHK